jgi:hypothetical protein
MQNTPNLRVANAYFNDEVSASPANELTWSITNTPAHVPALAAFGHRDQTLFEVHAFSPSLIVRGSDGSSQRNRQLVRQDRSFQCHWHVIPLKFQQAPAFTKFNPLRSIMKAGRQ